MHTKQVTGEFLQAPSSAMALAYTAQQVSDADSGTLGFLGSLCGKIIFVQNFIHIPLQSSCPGVQLGILLPLVFQGTSLFSTTECFDVIYARST